ncbi:MAG: permease-like cell division protein FtsX [Butyricicoccus sp.]|nr:permease-like cell division protein FtsX [Butyricicoccus sp.]
MKVNRFSYLIKEGIKSIFTHGFMSFASVTIIVACLIIMGSFSLLAVNVDSIISELEQENQILAFVDETLSTEEVLDIRARLEAIPNVRSVQFMNRDDAWINFVNQYDDPGQFSDLDGSVLRHRYVIYLDDLSLMEATAAAVEETRGIADISAHLEISRGFIMVRNIVSLISLIFIVILFVVSAFIMSNTIKLSTFNRKEEIAIMKMVGAGNAFIRAPFVVEGIVLGLLGGGIAFFLEWGVYSLIFNKAMASVVGVFIPMIAFEYLMWPMLLVFMGVGLIVGVFGSNIAIRNYLKV